MQAQATQAGLGTISYDPTTGLASGVGQGTGIGAFQPFLDESQRLAGAIGPDGQVTSAGVTAAMDPFMTPYQQQVIDASMLHIKTKELKVDNLLLIKQYKQVLLAVVVKACNVVYTMHKQL